MKINWTEWWEEIGSWCAVRIGIVAVVALVAALFFRKEEKKVEEK